jgi:hypothetical protein
VAYYTLTEAGLTYANLSDAMLNDTRPATEKGEKGVRGRVGDTLATRPHAEAVSFRRRLISGYRKSPKS